MELWIEEAITRYSWRSGYMMGKRGPEPRYVGEPLRGLPDWVTTPAYR